MFVYCYIFLLSFVVRQCHRFGLSHMSQSPPLARRESECVLIFLPIMQIIHGPKVAILNIWGTNSVWLSPRYKRPRSPRCTCEHWPRTLCCNRNINKNPSPKLVSSKHRNDNHSARRGWLNVLILNKGINSNTQKLNKSDITLHFDILFDGCGNIMLKIKYLWKL